jgi:hypothetical protein
MAMRDRHQLTELMSDLTRLPFHDQRRDPGMREGLDPVIQLRQGQEVMSRGQNRGKSVRAGRRGLQQLLQFDDPTSCLRSIAVLLSRVREVPILV